MRVAVASNFYPAMKEIVLQYELIKSTTSENHKIILIPGSSGRHYAQIMNGAPFDLFFSADKDRPILLEKKGISENGSRFKYALGKLVLWNSIVNSRHGITFSSRVQYKFIRPLLSEFAGTLKLK